MRLSPAKIAPTVSIAIVWVFKSVLTEPAALLITLAVMFKTKCTTLKARAGSSRKPKVRQNSPRVRSHDRFRIAIPRSFSVAVIWIRYASRTPITAIATATVRDSSSDSRKPPAKEVIPACGDEWREVSWLNALTAPRIIGM